MEEIEVSENQEATIVAAASALGAVAMYIATQPIPDTIKAPIVAVLGAVSVGLLAFWKAKVNKQPAY